MLRLVRQSSFARVADLCNRMGFDMETVPAIEQLHRAPGRYLPHSGSRRTWYVSPAEVTRTLQLLGPGARNLKDPTASKTQAMNGIPITRNTVVSIQGIWNRDYRTLWRIIEPLLGEARVKSKSEAETPGGLVGWRRPRQSDLREKILLTCRLLL